MDINALTSVIKRNNHYYKCDDEFVINNACGGKARVAYKVIKDNIAKGFKNFVTCGSRDSRQCEVVAKICSYLNVDCHIFMPKGKDTDVINAIKDIATIHRASAGYNNVVIANAQAFAQTNNYFYLPFGLEFQETIDINMHQVQNVPNEVKRIVVPCGGGMNMISVIKGLNFYKRYDVEVVGVIVGKKPDSVFKKFVDSNIFETNNVKYSFVEYPSDYHNKAKITAIDGIELDEVYEAKCIPFLQDNDLLWIVGKRL